MRNILDEIADYARERVKSAQALRPSADLKAEALSLPREAPFLFERSLRKSEGLAFICECKRASPSKGLIAEEFPYLDIAREYERAGADALSVLTEPRYFLGRDEYLQEIASNVNIPVLRKDFVIDDYMIYEAKTLGAGAVLLICSLLGEGTLRKYIALCDTLGMSALVEAHDDAEVNCALRAGARVIGVNNRNLRDFSVDTGNSTRLRKLIPEGVIFVSESGVKTAEDVRKIREAGADAVLIGEALMRAADKRGELERFRRA